MKTAKTPLPPKPSGYKIAGECPCQPSSSYPYVEACLRGCLGPVLGLCWALLMLSWVILGCPRLVCGRSWVGAVLGTGPPLGHQPFKMYKVVRKTPLQALSKILLQAF